MKRDFFKFIFCIETKLQKFWKLLKFTNMLTFLTVKSIRFIQAKNSLLLTVALIFSLTFGEDWGGVSCFAQTPDWLWAKSAGGSSYDVANSVTSDGSGNIFVAGLFASSTITFGSFTLTNDGYYDMFLVKYDNAGNVIWAKSAGGSFDDWAFSVIADTSENIFVAGSFKSSTITFGSFTLTITNDSCYDLFIVKYDNAGNVLWAKSAGGSFDDWAFSVIADTSENIFVAG